MGFEVNRIARFCLRLQKGAIIGAYQCTENKKCAFVSRACTDVHGFMIRKRIWSDLIESVPELSPYLKQNIKAEFIKNIYIKVIREKKRYLKSLESKKINNQVIMVHDLKKSQQEEKDNLYMTSRQSILNSERRQGQHSRCDTQNATDMTLLDHNYQLNKLESTIKTEEV